MHNLFKKREDKKKRDKCNDDTGKYRLRKPSLEHCILCFKPNLNDYTFEGSEIFKMQLTDPLTREIVINALDLVITKAMWEEDVTMNRQEPNEIRVEDKGILKLLFEPSLLPQTGQLRLNFKGNMSDKKLNGFYVYDNSLAQQQDKPDEGGSQQGPGNSGHSRQISIMTIFDPTEARRCFPCWDDPAVKMTYDIIMVVPKSLKVLGPTSIKASYPHRRDHTMEVVEFKQTPKLSTHSIGLALGSFEILEGKTPNEEISVRVLTPKGLQSLGDFTLSLVCKAIPFFEGYLGVTLPCQKLDIVAVPDYISSPVSCWGLIFFRVSDILVEPQVATLDLIWISLIICHEIIKQWFGCLTTFDWWSHQWLREGIATFLKYTFIHQLFPEWEVWNHFVTKSYLKALKIDAIHVSRPVEAQVISPADIDESLDEICLYKSSSVLRMMHRFVGDAQFRKGLQTYLERYQYGTATTAEFWKCMQDATSKPLVSMMGPWLQQRGYPVLLIISRQEVKSRVFKITQERFYYDPSHRDSKGQGQTWSIPITFSTGNHPTESVLDVLMDTKSITVTITDVGKNDWVKVNPGAVGFFRVRYPPDQMSTIVYAIREKSLPPADRLNILDDAFAFLLAGYSTTVEFLSLMEAFLDDDDYSVWLTISNIFDKCVRVFDHVGKADSFQSFGRFIFQQIFAKMGWEGYEGENPQKKLLRSLIIRMMAKSGNMEVVEHCKLLFENQFGKDPTEIPVDYRYAIYKTVAMYGDDATLKRFIRLYRESESDEERDRLAYAIGACRTGSQIMYVLDFANAEDIRRAHKVLLISSIAKTKLGKELGWNYVKENFSLIKGTFGPNQAGRLFQAILEDFASDEKVIEIQDFFKSNPFPGTEKAILKIIDAIRINEQWLKREKNITPLHEYLESMQ